MELPTPNPGSKSTPKACLAHNPTTSPQMPEPAPAQAPVTQSQELSGNTKNNSTDKQ